jgi:hypothetical protein
MNADFTHRTAHAEPEPMDALLHRFFRAELPKHWPSSPRPTPSPKFRSSRRLVLAASLLFLLLGQAYLFRIASRLPIAGEPSTPGAVEAMNRDGRLSSRLSKGGEIQLPTKAARSNQQ